MPDEGSIDLTYLGLGSNLARREANILQAVRSLRELSVGRRLRISSLYETAPVGCAPMPNFINAVVELIPLHPPGDLLKRLQAIERAAGRRGGHNQPRELDIDIIASGQRVSNTVELVLPHPRYAERGFVLVPLQELAPGFRCPTTGRSIDDLLAGLDPAAGVRRISSRFIHTR